MTPSDLEFLVRHIPVRNKPTMTEPTAETAETAEDSTPKILPIHTSCKQCWFAVYEGKTQTGCSFQNRIEQYKTLNAVLDARDDEREFFVVNGRHCNAFRAGKTDSGYPGDWTTEKINNYPNVVRKEIELHIDVMVPFEVGSVTVDLIKTVRSVQQQSLPFRRLYVVSNQDAVSAGALVSLLNTHAKDIEWYVTNVQERNLDNSRVNVNRALSHAADKLHKGRVVPRHFYVVVQPGDVVPQDLCQRLDEAVNDKLEQITVFVPDETLDVTVVHSGFHTFADSGRPMTVSLPGEEGEEPTVRVLNGMAEKAMFFAEAQNMPEMVRKVGSLWNS